ncbi:hypothetical protein QQZ08_008362 [Neonectria magnoliae]|uniref:AMP-dependent synthetase/ligase domain-containing protein n=1 Tax=Neonectria magnoliae TaxID=2732573 RepID=A0ABR1HV32_9HYPO
MAGERETRVLWKHQNPSATEMHRFMESINDRQALELKTFRHLYDYSTSNRSVFYTHLFEWANLIYEGSYAAAVDEAVPIDSVPRWFSGVLLNWAENVLFSRSRTDAAGYTGVVGKENDKIAVTEIREGNTRVRHVSWAELRRDAGRLAAALSARGVRQGDRIVLVGANSVSTLLVFLATTWLGAIFSSSSTDMGLKGLLQRAVQINPKASISPPLVFFDDAAVYNGRTIDLRSKLAAFGNGLRQCSDFSGVIAVPRFNEAMDVSTIAGVETWSALLNSSATADHPPFARIPFHHPFLICYSSGTTGPPKALVHSVGGVVLNSLKEERLHNSTSADTVALQFTTTGWIMYLLQAAGLLTGGRIVLYDGSPLWPSPRVLIDILEQQKVSKFGTSPRWMAEMAQKGIAPRQLANLENLRVITSTGMPLSDQLFEWVYDVAFPPQVHLINMSGGTDIAGCFGTGNPLTPVFVGGCQGPSLGVPIAIYEAASADGVGVPVPPGISGELVATDAFVNMPCFFWGDSDGPNPEGPAPAGSRYHSSYFARFKHVWTHGDFCMIHPGTHNIHFMGRADGVLNPSGVRFGSSEIYAVMETHFQHVIEDSLCVGQRRSNDSDESVMLFLVLRGSRKLERMLIREIKASIANELSKRHVPKYIFQVPEIPVTANGKKVELTVKKIVSRLPAKPNETLANPDSLKYFYQFADVERFTQGLGKL